MTTRVLILSSPEDNHARIVCEILEQMNVQVDYLRREELIEHCTLSYSTGTTDDLCLLERREEKLDFYAYSAIWHRRPGSIRAGNHVEPWISRMIEQECISAFDGILRTLPCLWMNYPPNDNLCLAKLWQLHVARQVGFRIPETIVTSDPEMVRTFFEKCDGQVIYKMIFEGSSFVMPPNERPSGISTTPLRKADLPFLDQVVHGPHLFQKSIQKAYELRVTVVGKKIFCIKIDSQSGRGKNDWRLDYSVPMEQTDLPIEISQKCLALMQILGLNYGALDLIVTKDDQYVFLEINCAGQYLWIESLVKNVHISKEIANLLAGESEPLVPPATIAPSMVPTNHVTK
jgi:glutathione synthase/RimK-type ligase-like ATP-grasp enzyme